MIIAGERIERGDIVVIKNGLAYKYGCEGDKNEVQVQEDTKTLPTDSTAKSSEVR